MNGAHLDKNLNVNILRRPTQQRNVTTHILFVDCEFDEIVETLLFAVVDNKFIVICAKQTKPKKIIKITIVDEHSQKKNNNDSE